MPGTLGGGGLEGATAQDQLPNPPVAASTSSSDLGKLIRMRALPVSEIPAHPDLAQLQTSSSPPALDAFITELITEAESFMTGYLPSKFHVKSKGKPSPPSTAQVELLSKDISASELPQEARSAAGPSTSEAWFARTSIHENAAKSGTASWDEFDNGLRANHSQNEKDYTPNVFDAHQVLDWRAQLAPILQDKPIPGGWTDVELKIMEMAHQIPSPLNDRVFPIVILTARRASPPATIDVQVPVDTSKIPGTKYCGADSGKTTTGMYCSVEWCTLEDNETKVKWQMATASDAKGVLPMWIQKMGVPGPVVKDVGLFIGWCAQQRK